MIPTFPGKVEKGRLILNDPDRFRVYLAKHESKPVEVVVKRKKSQRSSPNTGVIFTGAKKPNPRGRHTPGNMNKSEQAFAGHLDMQKMAREVRDWKFESIKLKLADNTYFIPDFNVEMANGDLVMYKNPIPFKGKLGIFDVPDELMHD